MIVVAATLAAAALASPPGIPEELLNADVSRVYGLDPSPDCAEWLAARHNQAPRSNAHETWVMGLLTGHNLYHPDRSGDVLAGTTLAAFFERIDQRCTRNPEAALPDVVIDLVFELRPAPNSGL